MGIVLPGPPENILLSLKRMYNIDTFIETGTFMARTTLWAAKHFNTVFTVEAAEQIFHQNINNHKNVNNITFILGDSRQALPQILGSLNKNTIMWLDAHWSGDITFGELDECPLIEELDIINQSENDHFIFIDDARIFLAPPPAPHNYLFWPSIDQVLNKLNEKERHTIIFDDVILSVPAYAREFTINLYRSQLKN